MRNVGKQQLITTQGDLWDVSSDRMGASHTGQFFHFSFQDPFFLVGNLQPILWSETSKQIFMKQKLGPSKASISCPVFSSHNR